MESNQLLYMKDWSPETIKAAARAANASKDVCGVFSLEEWARDNGHFPPDKETAYHVYSEAERQWKESLEGMEPIINLADEQS